MPISTLHPPNSQQLSENVITGVFPHNQRRDKVDVDTNGNNKSEIEQISPLHKKLRSEIEQISPLHKKLRTEQPKAPELQEEFYTDVATRSAATAASIADLLNLGKVLERERRRVNQARYRKKQNDTIERLEKEIEAARQHSSVLMEHKRSLSSPLQSNANFWSVVVKYFQFMGNGGLCIAQSSMATSDRATVQEKFVKETVKPDAIFNSEQGLEAILNNWRCLSYWFKDLKMELQDLQKDAHGAILATTTTSFTITAHTIKCVFPHLIDGGKSALVAKLSDQRIKLQGLTRFEWDSELCLVASVVSQSDFFTPLLHLLGALADVSTVFDGALVSTDLNLKLVSSSVY
ncbi:hypothetical protein PHMEG_00011436 [Phytophthora megakarya]|uniref:Bzip transcription factor n=1 Tax=Phytophthora megakarya TaxID=4795 RepID=A0A225WB82_9STRA|nr:hypothetical protein PHMEG_00011436 [Phytophthora megakarya]